MDQRNRDYQYQSRDYGQHGTRNSGNFSAPTSRATISDVGLRKTEFGARPARDLYSRRSQEYGNQFSGPEYSTGYSGDYGNRTRESPAKEFRSTVPSSDRYGRRSESPFSNGSRDSLSPSKIEDPVAKFEKGRIAVLQQERVHIQKKTFTKWCNSFLEKVSRKLF